MKLPQQDGSQAISVVRFSVPGVQLEQIHRHFVGLVKIPLYCPR